MSFFAVSAVLVFALDQVTKSVIQHGLENRPLRFGPIVTLRFLSSSKRYYRAAPVRAAMSILFAGIVLFAKGVRSAGFGFDAGS